MSAEAVSGAAMSVRVRVMTSDDIPAAMRLKDGAGWNQTVGDWERLLSASPDGCFAAESDGLVVGTSATIVYEGRVAWIGMVIVDPEHRGNGIGTTLLDRAIRHLDARGVPAVKLDATPKGKPLYEQFGFVREYEIERWALARPIRNPAPGLPVCRDIEAALQHDREVFGADRSALLRSVAAEAPDFVLVTMQEGVVVGHAFGRHGSRADHLGPWVAANEAVAATLLDQFLRRSTRELVFIDCVRDNPWAVPLAKAHGFEHSRSLTRMVRGPNRFPGRPELMCAILGPEFG